MNPFSRLLDWWALQRAPKHKRDTLTALYKRWQRAQQKATPERQQAAEAMRQQRIEIIAQLGEVRACAQCAKGCPLPQGQWDGGFCCGGHTEEIFSDQEITALQLSGTRFRDLRAPQSKEAGCTFRGPTGCSLKPANRPNQCIKYVCRDLSKELAKRQDAETLKAAHLALEEDLRRFLADLQMSENPHTSSKKTTTKDENDNVEL